MALEKRAGMHWFAGGGVAALLIPVLALGVGGRILVAVVIAPAAGTGCVLVLAPRLPFEGLDAGRIGRGKLELAANCLGEAGPAVADLRTAAKAIGTAVVRARVAHLASSAERILAAIEQDSLKLDPARRFLSYYLPRAAEMAGLYRLLEQKPVPDVARLQATSDLLDRLDQAFSKYADALFGADMDRLDIELKLLRASLDEDLGPVAAAPGARP